MTVNISNVGTNNTFDYWRNRTNELAYTFSVLAVTANGSNAAVGNAAITGKFTSDSLVVNTTAHVNNSLLVGNNSVDIYPFTSVNSTYISVGNSTVNTNLDQDSVNTYAVYIGSNVVVNTSQLYITYTGATTSNLLANSTTLLFRANTTVNTIANSTLVQITNGAALAVMTYNSLSIGNSLVNSTSISMVGANSLFANTEAVTVGSNVFMNTSTIVIGNTTTNVLSNSSTILVGNSTINTFANSSLVKVANSTISANITPVSFAVGTSLVNSTIITTGAGGLVANTSAATIGSNVVANTSQFYIAVATSNVTINAIAVDVGNSTVNALSNATLIRIANSTGSANLNPISLTIGTSLVNSTIITTGANGIVANTSVVKVAANIQINTSSYFVGNASVYSDSSINRFTIANNSGSANLDPIGLIVGTSVVNSTIITTGANGITANTSMVKIAANIQINTSSYFVGNTTANSNLDTNRLTVANSSGTANLDPISLTVGTSLVNSTVITTGSNSFIANTSVVKVAANIQINTSSFFVGNTTVYSDQSINRLIMANNSGSANLDPISLTVGTSIVNSTVITTGASGFTANTTALQVTSATIVNTTGFWTTGIANATAFTVGTSTISNSSGVYTTTVNATSVNAASHTVGTSTIANSSGLYATTANAASFTVGTSTIANVTGVYTSTVNAASHTVGTSTIANSTGVYTGVVNGSSITVGTSSIVNATGVYTTTVNAASHTVGSSTVANATGVYTGVVNGSSITVGTSFVANSSNLNHTGVITVGGNAQFNGTYANVQGSLKVGGDLIVSGNLTYTGISSADIVPAANDTYSVGNSTYKWATLWVTNANVTQSAIFGNTISVGGASVVNSTGAFVGTANAASFTVGSSTIANSTGVYTGVINATSLNIGTSFTANSSGINTASIDVLSDIFIGTATANLIANSSTIKISNSTVNLSITTPNSAAIASGQYFLNANGGWSIIAPATTNASITTTGTTTQEIDAYSMVSYPAAEYIVSVVDNVANNRYMSKILTTHDRGAGYMTEFATITTNTNVGTFSFVAPNVSHVALRFTPVSSNTTVKFVRTIVG